MLIKNVIGSCLIGFIAAAIVSGCVTNIPASGNLYNWDNVDKLKVGQTTQKEVTSLIGEPLTRSRKSDGASTWTYRYRPGTRISHLSMVANGGYTKEQMDGFGSLGHNLTVHFDPGGKIVGFSSRNDNDEITEGVSEPMPMVPLMPKQ